MIPSSRSRTFFFFGLPDNPRRRLSHVCVRRCEGSPPHSLFHRHLSAPPPPDGRRRTPSPARPSGTRRSTRGGLFWIQRECFSPIQLRRTKTITRGAFKSPSKNREKNQTALTVFFRFASFGLPPRVHSEAVLALSDNTTGWICPIVLHFWRSERVPTRPTLFRVSVFRGFFGEGG